MAQAKNQPEHLLNRLPATIPQPEPQLHPTPSSATVSGIPNSTVQPHLDKIDVGMFRRWLDSFPFLRHLFKEACMYKLWSLPGQEPILSGRMLGKAQGAAGEVRADVG